MSEEKKLLRLFEEIKSKAFEGTFKRMVKDGLMSARTEVGTVELENVAGGRPILEYQQSVAKDCAYWLVKFASRVGHTMIEHLAAENDQDYWHERNPQWTISIRGANTSVPIVEVSYKCDNSPLLRRIGDETEYEVVESGVAWRASVNMWDVLHQTSGEQASTDVMLDTMALLSETMHHPCSEPVRDLLMQAIESREQEPRLDQ